MDSGDPIHTCNEIADDYFKTFDQPSDHIGGFIDALPEAAHILDLGCGPGIDAAYLSENGFKVTGVDGAEKMIAIARKHASKATFKIADMRAFNYGHDRYDGIIASYSLTFLRKTDVPSVFSRLVDALKPNGVLFISLHAGPSQEVVLDEPFNPKLKIFLNIFSKQDVHDLLNKHALTILEEHERPGDGGEEFDFGKYSVLARKSA